MHLKNLKTLNKKQIAAAVGLLLLLVLAVFKCGDDDAAKRARENFTSMIDHYNKMCPIVQGGVTQVKVEQRDTCVYWLNRVDEDQHPMTSNRAQIEQMRMLLLLQMLTTEADSYEARITQAAANEGLTSVMHYEGSQGHQVDYVITAAEYKRLRAQDAASLRKQTLEKMLEEMNAECPNSHVEGLTLMAVFPCNDYVVYTYDTEGPIYFNDTQLRLALIESLDLKDPSIASMLHLMVQMGYGLEYVFREPTEVVHHIRLTPEELKSLVNG